MMRIIIEIDETNIGVKTVGTAPSTLSNGKPNSKSADQSLSAEDVGAGPSRENEESGNEPSLNAEDETSGNMNAGMAPETEEIN